MKEKWTAMPLLPVAWGEIFDKLTILEIKQGKLSDSSKMANVVRERLEIEKVVGDLDKYPAGLKDLFEDLRATNADLWVIEDGKRECERQQCFDDNFIELARKVYFLNDRRAAIKRAINEMLGSAIVEEKNYQPYQVNSHLSDGGKA